MYVRWVTALTWEPLELLFYDSLASGSGLARETNSMTRCFSLLATADGAVHRTQEVDQSGGWLESLQRETEEVCKMRVQLVV